MFQDNETGRSRTVGCSNRMALVFQSASVNVEASFKPAANTGQFQKIHSRDRKQ